MTTTRAAKADEPCLKTFDETPDGQVRSDDSRNRLLLSWLSDDERRAKLFELVSRHRDGILAFPSRAAAAQEPCCPTDEHPRTGPEIGYRTAYLVTSRSRIETALEDGGKKYSSRVYADLGGGNFMLALDPAGTDSKARAAHAAQMAALCQVFRANDELMLTRVSHRACESAAILSLCAQNFDLAAFAEQAALRFCQSLFGYAPSDHRLLETALRASYRALVYQVLGRHFVSDPVALPAAQQAMGPLQVRTAALIDAYEVLKRTDADIDDYHPSEQNVLKGCKVSGALHGLNPVLRQLGNYAGDLNGEQRAVIAVGAVAGTVGNVQAAVCIAVQAFLRNDKTRKAPRELAQSEPAGQPTGKLKEWQQLIASALRLNPPIAYLPRVQLNVEEDRGAYSPILLALGGGTRERQEDGAEDPLIWGLRTQGKHWCIGRVLAWPLIVETVRHVMGLPGIEEQLNPLDATPIGLKKRWGFACDSYPLSYRRDRRVAQSCLNVAMRVKAPVDDNAALLRELIRAGAPRIHEVLREARHLHFAWFEFIERDTTLVLHTVYDGDFAAYIQHFALRVGDLFDAIFQCIEDAPPTPVSKFPNDFVAHIQRYNRAPAMGYFFSAYPRSEAARIMREEAARP